MEAVKNYTDDQLSKARRLINILMGAPNNKRAMVAAVTTAYMDGVEAGVLIAEGDGREAMRDQEGG